ncbi:hypothetical protein [Sphingomonas lacusdianchii]|uniref:hypothetical protein n=1 Tax=Sphingomonas lacusdianchii TaxID=2917992 RepID=UPI001F5AFC4F|nr:hypothetical protein [Sphingomonas sp. JXJ CY 53]
MDFEDALSFKWRNVGQSVVSNQCIKQQFLTKADVHSLANGTRSVSLENSSQTRLATIVYFRLCQHTDQTFQLLMAWTALKTLGEFWPTS